MTDAAPLRAAADRIRFIERRYHQRHRIQLPRLVKMAEKVETLHETEAGVPTGLHDILTRLNREITDQMAREEAVLFPVIRRGSGAGSKLLVDLIRSAHEDQRKRIAEIQRLTCDQTLPDSACTSWATLYAGLAAFIDDLITHMRLENELFVQPCAR